MKPWQLIAMGAIVAAVLLFTTRRVSAAGLNFIKDREQLRLKAYPDAGGRLTIGWGHLIQPGEDWLKDPRGITIDQAETLLSQDIARVESAIDSLVTVPLTANQRDALISLIFNIGIGAFSASTLLKKLNAGDYEGAAVEFPRWKYAGGVESAGLLARRAAEQSVFLA
jgi:lysozyme